MNRYFRMILLCGCLLMLARCSGGGSFCDRLSGSLSSLRSKVQSCPTLQQSVTVTVAYDTATCNQAISHCSQADQNTLNHFLDCLGNIPNCIQGQETLFTNSLTTCGNGLSSITSC